MSWTNPRTWGVGVLADKAKADVHVRDNLNHLKTRLDEGDDQTHVFFVDDFLGMRPGVSGFAVRGWRLFLSGSASLSFVHAAGHPGIWRLSTGTTQSSEVRLYRGPVLPSDLLEAKFLFRPVTGIISVDFHCGLVGDVSDTKLAVQNGIFIRAADFFGTDQRYQLRTAAGGSGTSGGTTAMDTGVWKRVGIRKVSASAWHMTINDGLQTADNTSNIPSDAQIAGDSAPGIVIRLSNPYDTKDKIFDIDWFQLLMDDPIGQRYS